MDQTILCFGDSNTWGCEPQRWTSATLSRRYPWLKRWPGVLQRELGNSYRVVDDALNGRTTCYEDPTWAGRAGLPALTLALERHAPLYALILMLGTNDLKNRFRLSPFAIAEGMAACARAAKTNPLCSPKRIIVVSPIHVLNGISEDDDESFFDGVSRSQALAKHYQSFSQQIGCEFFDASTVASPSPLDGIHLDEAGNVRLGEALARVIQVSAP